MPTPRKRWFRVPDQVAHEPWSNDVLSFCIRLQGHLNSRWARDGLGGREACRTTLSPGQLMHLTGSASLVRARRIARALAAHVSLDVHAQGAYTTIEWLKWSEFQRLESETGADRDPENTPSASRVPRPSSSSPSEKAKPPSQKQASTDWLIPILCGKQRSQAQEADCRWWLGQTRDRIEQEVQVLTGAGKDPRQALISVAKRFWRQYLKDPQRHNYAINRAAAAPVEAAHEARKRETEELARGIF